MCPSATVQVEYGRRLNLFIRTVDIESERWLIDPRENDIRSD
jgi:hypothetical protein